MSEREIKVHKIQVKYRFSFPAIVRGEKSHWDDTWQRLAISRKIRIPLLKSDPDNGKVQPPVVAMSFVSMHV